jgi:nucleoside-diphosphate-sugar epimerase
MLTHLHTTSVQPARVVVIGAGGFVGGAIARTLGERGVPVLALARREVDLLAAGAADTLAALLRPDDAVVAGAAVAPVKTPQMLVDNVVIAETMAGALRNRPVAHLLNIGSDAVYGDSRAPMTEASPAAPGSLHGVMHLARELILAEAAGPAPFASLRATLIYGLDDPHDGYGPNSFRRLVAAGKEIVLFGAGEELRDHVAVEDVAELAIRILLHRSRGVLNAVSGEVVSFADIARWTVAHFPGAPAPRTTVRTKPMPHDGYRAFDAAAIRAAFPDYTPVAPEAGIGRVCSAMKEAS